MEPSPILPVPEEQVLGEAAGMGRREWPRPLGPTGWIPWAPCVHGNLERVTQIITVLGQQLLRETVNFFYPWLGDTLLSFELQATLKGCFVRGEVHGKG